MTASEKFVAFDLCGAYPLPEGRMLIHNPRNGQHSVLTPDVYGALLFCRNFHTLDDHAKRIVAANPALRGQEAEILGVLNQVFADGLMISADHYSATLRPAAQPNIALDKPVVAVITWERPDALVRCLESLHTRCDTDNFEQIVVIDDSRDEDIQRRNRVTTQLFSAKVDIPVVHYGAEEQASLMKDMIRQVPAIETQIRFLIDRERWNEHWTSGLARTVALLLSVGKRLVVLDDDILCDTLEPENPNRVHPGVGFGDAPREHRFYRGPEEWQEKPAEQATDPILRHLMTLGASLPDALATLGIQSFEPGAFEGADIEMLERLSAESRVLVTECGSLGDAGNVDLNWLASLEGDSLSALIQDDESVDKAFSFRNCWSASRRVQVRAKSNMSQLTGLDHRSLLPPYIPILRGEDALFGNMLNAIHPNHVAIDYPWAIAHMPIPERAWSETQKHFQAGAGFERLGTRWADNLEGALPGQDPVRRLGQLARIYEEMAEMDDEAMRRAFTDQLLTQRAGDFRMLTSAIAAAGEQAPAAWRTFLEGGRDTLNQELINNPPDRVVVGYPQGLQGAELMSWWRGFWGEFSQALRAWPAIRQAAKQATAQKR